MHACGGGNELVLERSQGDTFLGVLTGTIITHTGSSFKSFAAKGKYYTGFRLYSALAIMSSSFTTAIIVVSVDIDRINNGSGI